LLPASTGFSSRAPFADRAERFKRDQDAGVAARSEASTARRRLSDFTIR